MEVGTIVRRGDATHPSWQDGTGNCCTSLHSAVWCFTWAHCNCLPNL